MSIPNISKSKEIELQEMTQQYQNMSQAYNQIRGQVSQLQLESRDLEVALAELEKAPADAEVFKRAGSILVRKTAGDVKDDLAAKKEILEVRINRSKTQESQFGSQLQKLQETIQKKLAELKAPQ